MKNEEVVKIEPYKLLFPVGALIAIMAISFWLFFKMRFINFYPRYAHGNLMFFGFLWSFVAGFLMTAIPKMTKTFSANTIEISLAISLIFLQLILNLRNELLISSLILVGQNLFLLYFIVRRFFLVKKIPFMGMLFIPVAFLMSLVGVILFITNSTDDYKFLYILSGEAFFLNLIIGLGSRLIPVISRLPDSLMPTDSDKKLGDIKYFITVFTLNAGFILRVLNYEDLGLFLVISTLIFVAFSFFKLFLKPIKNGMIPIGLKVAIIFLVLGYILSLSYFNLDLAAKHIVYIAGFTLITILISFRVILAHGDQSLDYEISSKRILMIVSFFIIAALFRLIMKNQIQSYFLIAASVCIILGLMLWLSKFFKIYKNKF